MGLRKSFGGTTHYTHPYQLCPITNTTTTQLNFITNLIQLRSYRYSHLNYHLLFIFIYYTTTHSPLYDYNSKTRSSHFLAYLVSEFEIRIKERPYIFNYLFIPSSVTQGPNKNQIAYTQYRREVALIVRIYIYASGKKANIEKDSYAALEAPFEKSVGLNSKTINPIMLYILFFFEFYFLFHFSILLKIFRF